MVKINMILFSQVVILNRWLKIIIQFHYYAGIVRLLLPKLEDGKQSQLLADPSPPNYLLCCPDHELCLECKLDILNVRELNIEQLPGAGQ
jgi:hypothetical protein